MKACSCLSIVHEVRIVSGLRRLCGVVGLDRMCEDLIAALAAAAGAHTPAPSGSAAEGKQVHPLPQETCLVAHARAGAELCT